MGQALAFLLLFAIIYFPFIKPLTLLKQGNILIRRTLNENEIAKQKIFLWLLHHII